MGPGTHREKRVAPRYPADIRCWVGDGGIERYARIADINEYGLRIETAAPPPVGRSVTLRFKLPPLGNAVEAEGRVCWRSSGHEGRAGAMGVEFTRVLGRETIQAYSRRVEKGSAGDS